MSDQTFGFKCLRCGRTDLRHIKITNGGDWVCPGCWTDADWCRLGPSPKDAEIARALAAEVLAEDRRIFCELECKARLAAEAALESLRGEVREVVGEVEWEGQYMGRACCPLCGGLMAYEPPHKHSFILKDDTFGHAPDCRLAALLKRVGP